MATNRHERHPRSHIYDCHGVINSLDWKGDVEFFHTTFSLIANTSPETLLDYCLSRGNYTVSDLSDLAILEFNTVP